MGTYWTLHVLPVDPEFNPSAEQRIALMDYLARRTGVVDGFTVRGKGGLDAAEAGRALASAKGGVSCKSGTTDELRSDVLFGWNPDDEDDEHFWADDLEILITDKPSTFADPESEIPGREACLSIAFGGNKGWWPSEDLRSTFRDATFLPDLEELLGLPLVLVAISS